MLDRIIIKDIAKMSELATGSIMGKYGVKAKGTEGKSTHADAVLGINYGEGERKGIGEREVNKLFLPMPVRFCVERFAKKSTVRYV